MWGLPCFGGPPCPPRLPTTSQRRSVGGTASAVITANEEVAGGDLVLPTVKSGPPDWTKSRTFALQFRLAW